MSIREGAAELDRLHKLIHECYGSKARENEWRHACAKFNESFDSLAFPGGLDDGLTALKAGDSAARNAAILFLELDPMFFRSGYIKEEIIRRVKRFDLTPRETERVHSAILRVVATRSCRELRHFRSLARRFATPNLVESLEDLAKSGDPETSRRAKWVLKTVKI